MRLRHFVVFAVFPLLFCSCRVFFPSLIDLADFEQIDFSTSRVLRSQGGYRGFLMVGDRPGTPHAIAMEEYLVKMGIPGRYYGIFPEFTRRLRTYTTGEEETTLGTNVGVSEYFSSLTSLSANVRVVGIPYTVPFGCSAEEISLIQKSNAVFVMPVGNVSKPEQRFFWDRNRHVSLEGTHFFLWYNAFISDLLPVGKVLVAASVGHGVVDGQTVIFPNENTAMCGDTKEYCFSVYSKNTPSLGGSSSAATIRLSGIAFYLSQLFPTAEEAVSVLRECAIDVGEPGPDREYGVGVVNLFCAPVLEKELSVVSESSKASSTSSTLNTLTDPLLSSSKVLLFSSVDFSWGMQGHVGISYATRSLQAVAVAGFGFAPLGISSSLYQPARVPFVELGVRKPLIPNVAFVGTYGYQIGNLSVHSVRTGLQVEKSLQKVRFSVYGGRHFFRTSVGLPGYQMAGARKVSFSRSAWEARFSLTLPVI